MIICDESRRELLKAILDLNDEELQSFIDKPEKLKEFCAAYAARKSQGRFVAAPPDDEARNKLP